MQIEEAVLWVGFVTGILGAVSFVWQAVQYFTGRKAESHRSLNRNVLKPWSELKVQTEYGAGQANRIALMIPKGALPADAAPTTADEQGIEVQRLPGLTKGEAFLRKRHPDAFSHWVMVKALRDKYVGLLEQRRNLIEPMAKEGMSKSYPTLKPVRWKDKEYVPNTFILSHIVAEVESVGFWDAKGTGIGLNIQVSPTQADVLYYEFRGPSYPLLKVTDANAVDKKAFEEMLSAWIADPQVRKVNRELVQCSNSLEKSVDEFRTSLKEVAIDVDLTGD